MTVTAIKSCATTTCAYNQDGCSAYAVTIAGGKKASCLTFVTLDARGGVPNADGQVGACQRLECVHNAELMCSAKDIEIAADAECASYQPR